MGLLNIHPHPHPSSIRFTSSVLWPVLASLCWVATLIGLICLWVVRDGAKRYMPDQAAIAYISDAGAAHKALFVPGTATTAVFFTLSVLSERWLRHVDRIPGTINKASKRWDIAAIITGIAAVIFLVLCSIFDAFNHGPIHWSCAMAFVALTAVCAVCQTVEIRALKKDHPDRAHLYRNARIKMLVVVVALLTTIAFGVTYGLCGGDLTSRVLDGPNQAHESCSIVTSISAICEWAIAFLYACFLLTFVLDLWPAAKTSPRYLRRMEHHEAGRTPRPLIGGHGRGSPGSSFTGLGGRDEMAQV